MADVKAALTALAVAAGLLAGTGQAAAQPAESQHAGLARYYQQRLDWTGCADEALDAAGARCADVTVPLDYRQPDGRTITVAVSRLKADPARRRGVMLSNPGGPGAAGLNHGLLLRRVLSPDVVDRYDLIGMDPRGIGRSTAVGCGWPVGTMLRSAGVDRAGFDRTVALESDLARRCAEQSGDLLPYITTRNTARDMDVVRGALGERRISYLGVSYGTYLGAVYAQMFPQRTDRLVLDSAVDPRRYGVGMIQDMGAPSEAALDGWAAWTAQRDADYHLGTTARQVRAGVAELIRGAARAPIGIGEYRVDEHVTPMVLFVLLATPLLRPVLARAVRELTDAAAGRPVEPSRELAFVLDSQLKPNPVEKGAAQAAVMCGDTAAPRDPEWYWRNIRRSLDTQPVFGAFANNITACAFWAPPREQPTVVRNNRPALILQATGDTRSAYRNAVVLNKAMTGSRLVTLEDVAVHGVFGTYPNRCVENAVNTYLATGALPSGNITCHDDR